MQFFMQMELMLNWCVLNQCFVKSLSAQMLVHFLKFMALIRTKDCAVFLYLCYDFDLHKALCSFL